MLGSNGILLRVGAAQQRVYARKQLVPARGLDHVVVGAGFERKDDVLLGIAHGDEQHRHQLGDVAADPLEHIRAGHIGHLPVEHVEVEALAAGLPHDVPAACIAVYVVHRVSQPALQQRELVRVVFQDGNSQGGLRSGNLTLFDT